MIQDQYRSTSFYAGGTSTKLACLVAGYGGKIASYKTAINALLSQGYDVIAFEFDNTILTAGDPDALPQLIVAICSNVQDVSAQYQEILCAGVSLGAYIAFNVQRRVEKAKVGVYGTAGIAVSHAIFTARIFDSVRKAFIERGYDEQKLREAWSTIEILDDPGMDATKSLIIVMGKQDRIVRYKTASNIMDGWKKNGTAVYYFGLRGLGHAATISWYKRHLDRLVKMSDKT